MLNPIDENTEVNAIRETLKTYELLHPNAKVDAYRQNSGSIRVRIIDPDFSASWTRPSVTTRSGKSSIRSLRTSFRK